jgi:signal transduction histidine kinase
VNPTQTSGLLAATVADTRHLLAHEMLSPLLVIDTYSELLEERFSEALGDTGLRFVNRARDAARRISHQIQRALLLLQATDQALEPTPVDLSAVSRAIVAQLRAKEPGRECEVEVEDGMSCVGDARLLAVLMVSLLENAWKFSAGREPAHIRVASVASLPRGGRAFRVSDEGAGFDCEAGENLFKGFRRFHSEREFPGAGVGLAIAHRIVTRHGGRIWVDSRSGAGCTVWFTLDELTSPASRT